LDYTRIKKSDEIGSLTDQQFFDLEGSFPDRITRGANLPGDLPGWAGPITGLNRTLINVASTRVEAYDGQLDLRVSGGPRGDFTFSAIVSRQQEFERQTTPLALAMDTIGFSGGPLKWRGNAGMEWEKGPWSLGWNVQYYDSYLAYTSTSSAALRTTIVSRQGSKSIPSQMYWDVFAAHRFGNSGSGMLRDVTINLGVQNLFDRNPPIIATTSSLGGYSTYGDPRLRRFSIVVQKHF
jgi:outer membrane receptor protein involved in Fe transport